MTLKMLYLMKNAVAKEISLLRQRNNNTQKDCHSIETHYFIDLSKDIQKFSEEDLLCILITSKIILTR